MLDKICNNLEEGGSSPVISVKRAIIDDLKTRYQNDNICELMNKSSLLDSQLKSLIHLSEEEQTYTIDCLFNEIGSTFSPPAPPPIDGEEPELIVLDEQPPDSGHSRGDFGKPVRKKCMLEKLLGTFFSNSTDTSVTVSYNKLVMAELSRYKSEPILELKGKPLDLWKNHQHSYPNLSRKSRIHSSVPVMLKKKNFSL